MCGQGAGEWKLLATASSTTQQVATPWGRVGFLNVVKEKKNAKQMHSPTVQYDFFLLVMQEIPELFSYILFLSFL